MTRETKIGLVVAGSFLCLVCIVVASKWRDGDDAPDSKEQNAQQVATGKPKQNPGKSEPRKKSAEKSPKGTITIVPKHDKSGDKKKDQSGGFDIATLPKPPVSPSSSESDKIKEQLKLLAAQEQSQPPNPLQIGQLPAPPVTDTQFPPLDSKTPDAKIDPKKSAFPEVILPMPPEAPGGFQIPQAPSSPTDDKKGKIDDKKGPVVPGPEVQKPADLGGLRFPPLGGIGAGQLEPKDAKKIVPQKDDPLPAAQGFPPLKPIDPLPGAQGADPALPNDGQKPRIVFPARKDMNDPGLVAPPLIPKDPPIAPPLVPKDPPVTISPPRGVGNEIGGGQLIPTIPSDRQTPAVPSITVPGSKPLMPVVKDVNADFYAVRAGETSFAIVSLLLYKNDKYADALQAYNRDHSRLIANGAALTRNPPALNPGQQVLHPPVGILERDYRALIREPSAIVTPTIPAVQLARPAPLGGTPVSAPPAGPSGRMYTVQNAAGESILDIAERTLGNRGDWFRIHELNRQYPPQFRIPAGTQLKLP